MRTTRLAAILFAELDGFAASLAEDEQAALAILSQYRAIADPVVEEHEGEIVDATGEELLVVFESAVSAVQCALHLSLAARAKAEGMPPSAGPRPSARFSVRIGIHLGEIWRDETRVYGNGVNVAARVKQAAASGSILVSEDVERQISNKLDLDLREIPAIAMKNIERPLRLFEISTGVRAAQAGARATPPAQPGAAAPAEPARAAPAAAPAPQPSAAVSVPTAAPTPPPAAAQPFAAAPAPDSAAELAAANKILHEAAENVAAVARQAISREIQAAARRELRAAVRREVDHELLEGAQLRRHAEHELHEADLERHQAERERRRADREIRRATVKVVVSDGGSPAAPVKRRSSSADTRAKARANAAARLEKAHESLASGIKRVLFGLAAGGASLWLYLQDGGFWWGAGFFALGILPLASGLKRLLLSRMDMKDARRDAARDAARAAGRAEGGDRA